VKVPSTTDGLRLINAKIRLMEKEAEVALLHERASKRSKIAPDLDGGPATPTEAAVLTSTVTQLAVVIRGMKEEDKAQTRSSKDGDQAADIVRGIPHAKQSTLSLAAKGALSLQNHMETNCGS
jgi:hypothetical protein